VQFSFRTLRRLYVYPIFIFQLFYYPHVSRARR
jgi:hypothetical protein